MLRLSLLFLMLLQACAYYGNHSHNLSEKESYQVIPSGKVHKSCLERFGMKLINIIEESNSTGMACLANLRGEGAKKNYAELEKLFASKDLSYHCNEFAYRWKGVGAHASLGTEWNNEKLGLVHPYISVYPSYVLIDSNAKGEVLPEKFLRNVIFHEYFHLVGYLHNSGVEYAYTCEDCCFDQEYRMDSDHKKIACKICSSEYGGIDDPGYLKDLLKWSEKKVWNGVRLSLVLRVAMYKSKSQEKIWSYYFQDKPQDNLVQKFLAINLLEDSSKSFSKNVVKAAKKKISSGLEELVPLATEVARIEKLLLVEHKLEESVSAFSTLDYKSLKYFLRLPGKESSEHKAAVILWDSVLYDMDLISMEIGKKKSKVRELLDDEYKKVQDLWKL